MRKAIVAINVTLDGFCDHTAGIVDDELLDHYTRVLGETDTIIMGRVTYQMMESYWPDVAKNKTGSKADIEFAETLNNLKKILVSNTLKQVTWKDTRIISENIVEEVKKLKEENGKSISIGGPSLISYLARHDLIDEYNFVVHPFVLGRGIPLFTNLTSQINLDLVDVKKFASGAVSLRYRVDH